MVKLICLFCGHKFKFKKSPFFLRRNRLFTGSVLNYHCVRCNEKGLYYTHNILDGNWNGIYKWNHEYRKGYNQANREING